MKAPWRIRDEAGYAVLEKHLTESGLEVSVKEICKSHFTSLRHIYLDTRGPSVLAARIEVWWTLMKVYGKAHAEIGTIFNRDRSSISWALRRLYIMADGKQRDVEVASVHELAKAIAAETEATLRRVGQEVAATGLGVEARNGATAQSKPKARVHAGRTDRDTRSPGDGGAKLRAASPTAQERSAVDEPK
jgi:hypothetical protein